MNFLGSDLTNAPPVMQPPQSFLSTMEEYVKDAPRAASSKTLYLKDVPVSDEILFLKWWNSLDIEMRIYLILLELSGIGGWGATPSTYPAHSIIWH